MQRFLLVLSSVLILTSLNGQPTVDVYASSSIRHQLKLFEKAGKVLYLAAHPDDENTRMITWLANEAGVETAYLSLTRGDGGQNLIGPQLGEQLGVIRTQELIEARRIDGGMQFFTRALDFGYSKSADESLKKWGHADILEDVVTVIRRFKPDVIINRFPPDRRAGHGHHEASAILAEEAFALANDPSYHRESVDMYGTWEVKNLFWNTSTWWVDDLDTSRVGEGDLLHVDVGGYHPLIGKNLGELASSSRSMHKSQGFGIAKLRGKIPEYLERVKGAPCTTSIFDHVDTSLSRLNAHELQRMIVIIRENFDDDAPWESVPALVGLYPLIEKIEDVEWREIKRKQLNHLIIHCTGIHAEMLAKQRQHQITDAAEVTFNVINRSPLPVFLKQDDTLKPLPQNERANVTHTQKIRGDYSHPFYLQDPPVHNMFQVSDLHLMPQPERDFQNSYTLGFVIYGQVIPYELPLMYKWTDRVKGERYQTVDVVPPVRVDFSENMAVVVNGNSREVRIEIHALTDSITGEIKLEAPEGWRVSPSIIPFSFTNEREVMHQVISIEGGEGQGRLKAQLRYKGEWQPARTQVMLDFDHFKPMRLQPRAEVALTAINVKRKFKTIGYIKGAGDDVAEALSTIGYKVEFIGKEDLASGDLRRFDAIVAGIRAYNTNEWLATYESQLRAYVENGGRYIIQYNTVGWRSAPEQLGGWPIDLGRDRVTVEESPVTLLDVGARVWRKPNRITDADFDHWVQERGLYFASQWSDDAKPLVEMNDPGEESVKGAIVVAPLGKGYVTYTGLSFFRQLPAGVPGAFRLLVNLIEYRD
jgi:LmbE family N-acetylglucosaminyl deacetylase